jgi:hypothetical protein
LELRARESAGCPGGRRDGDITRKKEPLEKGRQKRNAQMQEYGDMSIPQPMFIAALPIGGGVATSRQAGVDQERPQVKVNARFRNRPE